MRMSRNLPRQTAIFSMSWGDQQGGREERGGTGVAQSLDRDREIYEPVFIGRVVSFIDVAEVGMEC
jgi:hypothetical protein